MSRVRGSATGQQRENVRMTIKARYAREFYVPRCVPDLTARESQKDRDVFVHILRIRARAVLFSENRVPTILGRAANL